MRDVPPGARSSSAPAPVRASRASLTAAVLGNVLEFYDFTVYSFFALFIGRTFFPTESPTASLLLSVATFGVGFLTRPLGAAVLGPYADRAGRRAALLVTIVLMGLGMALLALTPSYASIGVAAPLLAVVARLLQGFALGGEVGAASAFLIESVPVDRRGFFGAWQIASQGAATLIAGVVGVVLSALLPQPALEAWGWRIAVLIGLAIVPVGLIMRRALPETLAREEAIAAPTIPALLRTHPRPMLLGVLAIMSATITIYTLNYMTTYAVHTLHLPVDVALAAPIVTGALSLVFALAGGALSDRVGRKPMMIVPRVVLVLVAYPAYILVNAVPSAATLLAVTALLTLLNAPSSAITAVIIPESFPAEARGAGFALVYAASVTVFGGSAQVIVTWLIAVTGDPLAPAGYLVVANVIGLIAMAMMKETHPMSRAGAARARIASEASRPTPGRPSGRSPN